jgi:hypothetical protein
MFPSPALVVRMFPLGVRTRAVDQGIDLVGDHLLAQDLRRLAGPGTAGRSSDWTTDAARPALPAAYAEMGLVVQTAIADLSVRATARADLSARAVSRITMSRR